MLDRVPMHIIEAVESKTLDIEMEAYSIINEAGNKPELASDKRRELYSLGLKVARLRDWTMAARKAIDADGERTSGA